MLVKKFEKDPNYPDDKDMVYWRYWCTCLTPTHVLELYQHGEDLEVAVHVCKEESLWRRIKLAWQVLRGEGFRWTEVVIGQEDRNELAAVIKGDVVP